MLGLCSVAHVKPRFRPVIRPASVPGGIWIKAKLKSGLHVLQVGEKMNDVFSSNKLSRDWASQQRYFCRSFFVRFSFHIVSMCSIDVFFIGYFELVELILTVNNIR